MSISLSEHFTYKKLLRFVFPSIIMMIFTSIYSVVDGLFVSNFVVKQPLAAINLIMPFIMGISCIRLYDRNRRQCHCCQTLGEQKEEKAIEYFSLLVYATAIGGLILSLLGIIFTPAIARMLGAHGELLKNCTLYGRISFISMTAFMMQNVFQSFFVTAGKPKLGLYVITVPESQIWFLTFCLLLYFIGESPEPPLLLYVVNLLVVFFQHFISAVKIQAYCILAKQNFMAEYFSKPV